MGTLEVVLIILLVLWLAGIAIPVAGQLIHLLLVVVVILLILRVLGRL